MACTPKQEEFETYNLNIILLALLTTLKSRIDQDYYEVIDSGYHKLLSESIKQAIDCVEREPFTHESVIQTHRKLLLIKEPLLQLRFEVDGTDKNAKLVLNVFSLHELYNCIAKLVDCLHNLSHSSDKLDLDKLDFRTAISKHLSDITNQSV